MDRIEKLIIDKIDEQRERIIEFGRDVFNHAELGFKEYRTAEKFAGELKELGLEVKEGLAITGVKGYLKHQAGPRVALVGELDALRIPTHPNANPETQAAHSCGHNAQLAGVFGAALALCCDDVKAELDGDVVFFGVPSEEFGEIEFKSGLIRDGKIRYGGGKCELIRIGEFDDIDISVTHHSADVEVAIGSGTSNAFVSKVINYKGRAAHAAGAPHKGINALNAANLGLTGIAFQRETFKDDEHVRIHPIMTAGGDLANIVPDNVVLETMVRAKSLDGVREADMKTDRALIAGAKALGAGLTISTIPGYLSTLPLERQDAIREAAKIAAPDKEVIENAPEFHMAGSTDVGDICHIMPVLQFNTGGTSGAGHSPDYQIVDEEIAYVLTAKIFALTAYRLLKDRAAEAKEVLASYKQALTKNEYIEYMESMMRTDTVEMDYIGEE